MNRLTTLFVICLVILFTPSGIAQDGGKKKDKKKKSTEQVDSTANKKNQNAGSGNGGGEITIDEPGNTRGKTNNNSSQKTDGDTLKPKATESAPKEAEKPQEKPKEETAKQAEVGAPAEGAPHSTEAAPAPPAGAGGIDASGSGTSLTIDEAGTQRVKKPADAMGSKVDVNPTNLTIDEAGTQKVKKTVEAPNLAPSTDSLKQKAGGKVLDLIKPR
jgi:hypothetical protein